MGNFFIPSEEEFRRWVKEAVNECLESFLEQNLPQQTPAYEEPLRSRKEIASMFGVSLVTLTDWAKRGLPRHKQRGRVYYLRSEVIDYMKKKGKQ